MKLSDVLTQRVRGFRVFDLVALTVFLALALTVYAFKTSAGRERTDIADVEAQIRDESRQVRLLQGQIARLESPDRLERLSTRYLGLGPVNAKQEIPPEALPQVAGPVVAPGVAQGNSQAAQP
jgi:hypothetical protein